MKNLHVIGLSACVFGSAARASTDELSDKDILVTAKESSALKPAAQELTDEGWSVSAYTHSRLMRMASAGSLFVQHLKLEGKIIQDPSNWLADFFDAFNPKASYEEDAVRSFDLARPLERIMNSSQAGYLAADLGHVFIRNYAINHLASKGVFIYDYGGLMEELQGVKGFSSGCLKGLIELRKGKHTYRSGVRDHDRETYGREVADWVSEACSDLDLRPVAKREGVRKFDLNYATLRDFEAALVESGFSLGKLKAGGSGVGAFRKMISNPRNYSWQIRSIDSGWISSANKLLLGQAGLPRHESKLDRDSPESRCK